MSRTTVARAAARMRALRSTPDELLERVGLGDLFAFSDLYDLVELRVVAMVRSVLVDPVLSLEVAQTAHLEIWQTAPRFDPRSSHAESWVLAIARSCALDRLRASVVRRDRGILHSRDAASPAVASAWAGVDFDLGRERFPGASPADRERIVRAYSDAYSSAEIALELSRPGCSVASRMLASLRAELQRRRAR